jgi:hypothetical protein
MLTILMMLFACGEEEKAEDSAQPAEEQQETVEDTGEQTPEDSAVAE